VSEKARWHAGDWVEVRSAEEILGTLDKRGELEGMPFMPEMLKFAGRRLRVVSSAHKTCDTIHQTGGRTLNDAVHLEDVRCDGQAHGGCQAACLIFWKGAWVKRVDGPESATPVQPAPSAPASNGAATNGASGCTMKDLDAATRSAQQAGSDPVFSCQSTELLRATTPLPWWDVRQYVEDHRTGNVGLRQIVAGFFYAVPARIIWFSRRRPRVENALISLYDRVQSLLGGARFPRRRGSIPLGQPTPTAKLDLQEGELVKVKPYEEIIATLDEDNKNRGMFFDAEMAPYCGSTFRIRTRVSKIVDEKSGKMLSFKTPSLILEDAYCKACYSDRRMFCPRAIYSYWREIWLERVPSGDAPAPAPTPR
jgi:hypothetical protein